MYGNLQEKYKILFFRFQKYSKCLAILIIIRQLGKIYWIMQFFGN